MDSADRCDPTNGCSSQNAGGHSCARVFGDSANELDFRSRLELGRNSCVAAVGWDCDQSENWCRVDRKRDADLSQSIQFRSTLHWSRTKTTRQQYSSFAVSLTATTVAASNIRWPDSVRNSRNTSLRERHFEVTKRMPVSAESIMMPV